MSKSQETYSKKEREKKRQKRKKEKMERRAERKANPKEKKSFEEMLMYVDEDGNLTPTPPDPAKKKKFKLEDINVSVPKSVDGPADNGPRTGQVKFFNFEKGYGFIVDDITKDSIFVHANNLQVEQINERDKVTYEVEMGPKGPNAIMVKLAVEA